MKSENNNNCPSCGNELHNGLCEKCGYLKIVFPKVVPDSIKQMESTRLSVIRRLLDENKELKLIIEKNDKQSGELVSKLNQKIQSYSEQNERLKKDNEILLTDKDSLKLQMASLEEGSKNRLSNERKLEQEILNLQSLLTQKESELQSLSSELKNVKQQLSEISAVSFCPVCGNKFISDEFDFCPICGTKRFKHS